MKRFDMVAKRRIGIGEPGKCAFVTLIHALRPTADGEALDHLPDKVEFFAGLESCRDLREIVNARGDQSSVAVHPGHTKRGQIGQPAQRIDHSAAAPVKPADPAADERNREQSGCHFEVDMLDLEQRRADQEKASAPAQKHISLCPRKTKHGNCADREAQEQRGNEAKVRRRARAQRLGGQDMNDRPWRAAASRDPETVVDCLGVATDDQGLARDLYPVDPARHQVPRRDLRNTIRFDRVIDPGFVGGVCCRNAGDCRREARHGSAADVCSQRHPKDRILVIVSQADRGDARVFRQFRQWQGIDLATLEDTDSFSRRKYDPARPLD